MSLPNKNETHEEVVVTLYYLIEDIYNHNRRYPTLGSRYQITLEKITGHLRKGIERDICRNRRGR